MRTKGAKDRKPRKKRGAKIEQPAEPVNINDAPETVPTVETPAVV